VWLRWKKQREAKKDSKLRVVLSPSVVKLHGFPEVLEKFSIIVATGTVGAGRSVVKVFLPCQTSPQLFSFLFSFEC
jgi:hypothetical protein